VVLSTVEAVMQVTEVQVTFNAPLLKTENAQVGEQVVNAFLWGNVPQRETPLHKILDNN
jgi:hypothetical protein